MTRKDITTFSRGQPLGGVTGKCGDVPIGHLKDKIELDSEGLEIDKWSRPLKKSSWRLSGFEVPLWGRNRSFG
jgi:hypothetical protein